MRILIAEDNRFYRLALETTISGWGYEVVSASDGLAAWQILQGRDAPSLAVLDWLMPGLSGLELCRKVRSLDRPWPVYLIMLTAKGEKEDVLTALRAGADDYIGKPFDAEELHARLQVGMRIVGLQQSLTERVGVLENALSGAQKIDVIGRLAGGIAHDFNNLLTVVMGYSDLLVRTLPRGEGAHEFASVIRQTADRGAALTRQLLAFARKQVLNPTVLDLNGCVVNVEKLLRRLLGEHIQVVTRLEQQLNLTEADPGQIDQVLVNLLINARDAMPEGGTVTITTANAVVEGGTGEPRGVSPGTYVVLSVTDTGCGMDQETMSHLFEPFFTTKGVGKGTGLGLATAYGIVRQSGGFIRVESEVGRGSTFSIYLPRTTQSSLPVMAEPTVVFEGGNETLLLVEDEPHVRVLLNSVLTLHGYTVLEAGSGEEALRVSREYGAVIDMVLTDVVMPGLSGVETVQRLRGLWPNLKALYISGYNDVAIVGEGKVRSSGPLLQKPFAPEVLVARVREELGRRPASVA